MKRLKSTQGALVPMPLDFLKDVPNLLPEFGTIEYVAPDMLFKWPFSLIVNLSIFYALSIILLYSTVWMLIINTVSIIHC